MLKILEISKFFKTSFLFFFLLFLFSCEKPLINPVDVVSGVFQREFSVFEKSCNEGSLQVFQSVSNQGVSTSSLGSLEPGNKVSIKGRITQPSPCYQSAVSFTCEAKVVIGDHRSFVCETGSILNSFISSNPIYGPLSSPFRNPTTPSSLSSSSTSRSFNAGNIHIFGNGNRFHVEITTGSSSNLVPQATCTIGFSCLGD